MSIAAHTCFNRSLIATISIVLLLGACRSTPKPAECDDNKSAYLQATDNGALTIPAGLETPEQRNALKVPVSNGKTIDPKTCLQQPPSYFGTAGRIAASPEEMVADWAQAWADRNADAVMSMYSSEFSSDAPAGSAAWLAQRRVEINSAPLPNSRVTDLKVASLGDDQRVATFAQRFADTTVRKELRLVRDAGLWKISEERVITAK
ncbi:MAG: hypothetical protein AB7F79_02575 [Steroidobacteraceae bacterium]